MCIMYCVLDIAHFHVIFAGVFKGILDIFFSLGVSELSLLGKRIPEI